MARLTLVVNGFDEGSETFLHSLADHVVALGYELTVHAMTGDRTTMRTGACYAGRGVTRTVALPPVSSPLFPSTVARLVRSDAGPVASVARRAVERFGPGARAARAAALAAPLIATRPDVVHLAFSGIGLALLDALELLDGSTKVLVSCRGSGELVAPIVDPSLRPRLAQLFGRVDAVHAVADAVAAASIGLGADPAELHVIRPAIDVDRFTRVVSPVRHDGVTRVVAVARLHWIKGIELQLEAAAELRRRGVDLRWTIVGDGPQRDELELRSRWSGAEGVVEFVGAMGGDEIRAILDTADVFVLSSWSEGTANSVLEAMALEVPVVSTAVGGMPEVLHDGVDSMVVPVGDADSLARAVERLAEQPELAARLAAAGRRTVAGGHTLELQRQRWGELYESLTCDRPTDRGTRR